MKFLKSIGAVMLAGVLAVSLVACGVFDGGGAKVAATVGGVDVSEADVTARIETFMKDSSTGAPLDPTSWAKLLKSAGFTPEDLREYIIKQQFAVPILAVQDAKAAGIAPDAAAIDEQISQQKASMNDDAAQWESYLKGLGYATEDAYRQYLEYNDVINALLNSVIPNTEPTQSAIEEYVLTNAVYYTGKRSSSIFVSSTGERSPEEAYARAEEALARLNDGEEFATLAGEYSDDAATSANGGDMGWSFYASLPAEYTTALADMDTGDTSGIVETDNGYYLIRVTENFAPPSDGTLEFSAVPSDIVESLTASLKQNDLASAQQAYFEGLTGSDKIVINPMPSGLSYDVDMALADEPEPAEDVSGDQDTTDPGTQGTDQLEITDTVVGEGPAAQVGDTVSMLYTGYLEDGTVFDSNYESGVPYQLTLGNNTVIQGWEQGIPGMQVGGKRHLVIPASLGYGANGNGSIPPNATLIFDVELVSID